MTSPLVPINISGKETDLQYVLTLPDLTDAITTFKRAQKRLLNPTVWHELCGPLSASFTLIAPGGYEAGRLAQTGDYFRVDIPGPGSSAGEGYDWVQLEAIEDKTDSEAVEERFGIRVRACSNPNNQNGQTAHFFKDSATSSFVLQRSNNIVSAYYHGRNERPNTHTGHPLDNVRNALVAASGMAGLSEAQWYALLKGLLHHEL